MNTPPTTHPNTSMLGTSELAAYRTWRDHRTGPAYVRGVPSWIWQSALSRRAGS